LRRTLQHFAQHPAIRTTSLLIMNLTAVTANQQ
jgi:hypothetical protein